ncbi:LuxR family transcriptional regulator [Buttiauxella izardii]|uniref:LuxR family transcriptional regulator n=2 Tax=Buttiauxella izardii TaxID=82991 RepID=A0A3A5K5Z5_9ENTR|nr:LuxR family transcriptional regulator [Buttiauxella izardii]
MRFKMLNIAFEDTNALYRKGMELFLKDVFSGEQNKNVKFNSLTSVNSPHVDIIVKNFVAGAEYVCQPILKFRRKPGLIIGITDGEKNCHHNDLPLCIKNIVFVHRSESLNSIRENVTRAWKDNLQNQNFLQVKKCLQCKYRTLTPQQVTIAKHLLRGCDIMDIAELMNVNVKTVSAHKRLMMRKFNLSSDCELLQFLNNLKMHNPPVNLF